MIIERMTNLSNGISPLRNLTNKYQDSTKPDPSAFLMKEKLFLGKISLFGKEDLFFKAAKYMEVWVQHGTMGHWE